MLGIVCVWTCLERQENFAEIAKNRAVNLGPVITTHLIIKTGMEMTTLVPARQFSEHFTSIKANTTDFLCSNTSPQLML